MKEYKSLKFEGERCLFNLKDISVTNCHFSNGESPLKECENININNSKFSWKYPIWYSNNVIVNNSYLDTNARSGIWYTNNITINDSIIDAPKQFRRSNKIKLKNVKINNAQETMWNCSDIELNDVYIKGDYFGMNSSNIVATNIKIDGNYVFDGGSNIEIRDSVLNSKDSFWNCKNVTVYNSKIEGEYLGWNSQNLTFINCDMSSLQGFCYIKNLKLVDCKLKDTTLAFEYSTVDVDLNSKIDSVKNPLSGIIKSQGINELILDENIKSNIEDTKYEVKENV